MMDRRAFLGALAGGLLTAPLAAEGQQAGRVYRIGYFGGGPPASAPPFLEAFRHGLQELGWVEGRHFVIEYRSTPEDPVRRPEVAAELVRLNVDVIVATSPPSIWAAKDATKTIPIVMVFGPDPVESGLVQSLARPGGNITGLTTLSADLSAKHLELLKDIAPGVSRVAVLWNPTNPWHSTGGLKSIEARARSRGIQVQAVGVRGPDELDAAFTSMTQRRSGGLLVLPDPLIVGQRVRIAGLAVKHRLPTICGLRESAEAGCLASYWPDSAAVMRRAANYVDKILKGAKPGDLPVEQPSKFELVINLKTAKALGLTIPPSLLQRADQVIE
jgi:putative tryptophan/tyrosine transport system substrate-binding protein